MFEGREKRSGAWKGGTHAASIGFGDAGLLDVCLSSSIPLADSALSTTFLCAGIWLSFWASASVVGAPCDPKTLLRTFLTDDIRSSVIKGRKYSLYLHKT